MAELTSFNYCPGNSYIHSLDVRFKLAVFILCSLATLNAKPLTLMAGSILLIIVFIHLRLPVIAILKEIRFFFLLMFFVFVARSLTMAGTPFKHINFLPVSREGMYDGALIVWRLLTIVLLAIPFMATTRPSEINAAVAWYLKPFPFIPRKRIAMMMSLIVRFIPVIFEQARETADAQRARGVESRKNPVYRIIKFAVPLIRRTFETADQLAVAMEARCYSENRTQPEFSARLRDWVVLMIGVCLFFLSRIY
jgi:energy-coupling factor transporter transmembrane protein EcfT